MKLASSIFWSQASEELPKIRSCSSDSTVAELSNVGSEQDLAFYEAIFLILFKGSFLRLLNIFQALILSQSVMFEKWLENREEHLPLFFPHLLKFMHHYFLGRIFRNLDIIMPFSANTQVTSFIYLLPAPVT